MTHSHFDPREPRSSQARAGILRWAPLGLAVLAFTACSSEKKESEAAPQQGAVAGEPAESAPAAADLAAGKAIYETNCAACHGATGTGDGAAAAALDPKPRDFTNQEYMASRDRDTLRKVIVEGGASVGLSPMMVAWGSILKPEDIDPVLDYILSFGK